MMSFSGASLSASRMVVLPQVVVPPAALRSGLDEQMYSEGLTVRAGER